VVVPVEDLPGRGCDVLDKVGIGPVGQQPVGWCGCHQGQRAAVVEVDGSFRVAQDGREQAGYRQVAVAAGVRADHDRLYVTEHREVRCAADQVDDRVDAVGESGQSAPCRVRGIPSVDLAYPCRDQQRAQQRDGARPGDHDPAAGRRSVGAGQCGQQRGSDGDRGGVLIGEHRRPAAVGHGTLGLERSVGFDAGQEDRTDRPRELTDGFEQLRRVIGGDGLGGHGQPGETGDEFGFAPHAGGDEPPVGGHAHG
jgi:hypothetical protein